MPPGTSTVPDRDASDGVVSVLMSVFNRSGYVEEAIESVLADPGATHELVIIDDGSSDGAQSIVGSYADRAVVLEQDHRGCPAAWNLGLQHAIGDYVTFCDSDDVWMPE